MREIVRAIEDFGREGLGGIEGNISYEGIWRGPWECAEQVLSWGRGGQWA